MIIHEKEILNLNEKQKLFIRLWMKGLLFADINYNS